jgi:hypothetical protein
MSCRTLEVQVGKRGTEELTATQCAGLDLIEILGGDPETGCGEKACVYTTPDSKTLIKVTKDADDVYGFVAAKGSGVIPKAGTPVQLGDRPLFAFKVAKVQTIEEPRDQLILNDVLSHGLIERIFGQARPKNERDPIPMGRGKFHFTLPADIDTRVDTECVEMKRRIEKLSPERQALFGPLHEFTPRCRILTDQAVSVIEKLGQHGVKFADAHAGNWGFDKGRLVAIDLGLSNSPKPRAVKRLNGTETLRWPRWR